jgi:hypothetical protein
LGQSFFLTKEINKKINLDESDSTKTENKESLVIENINTFVLRYPQHYQSYMIKALKAGDALEEVLEVFNQFNL